MKFTETYIKSSYKKVNLINYFNSTLSTKVSQYKEEHKTILTEELFKLENSNSNFLHSKNLNINFLKEISNFPMIYKLINLKEAEKNKLANSKSDDVIEKYSKKYSSFDSIIILTQLLKAECLLLTSNSYEEVLNLYEEVLVKCTLTNNKYLKIKALASLAECYVYWGINNFAYELSQDALKLLIEEKISCPFLTNAVFLGITQSLNSVNTDFNKLKNTVLANEKLLVPQGLISNHPSFRQQINYNYILEEIETHSKKLQDEKDNFESLKTDSIYNLSHLGKLFLDLSANSSLVAEKNPEMFDYLMKAINCLESFEALINKEKSKDNHKFFINTQILVLDNINQNKIDPNLNLLVNKEFIESNFENDDVLGYFKYNKFDAIKSLCSAYSYKFLNQKHFNREYIINKNYENIPNILSYFPYSYYKITLENHSNISLLNSDMGYFINELENIYSRFGSFLDKTTLYHLNHLKITISINSGRLAMSSQVNLGAKNENTGVINSIIEKYKRYNHIHNNYFGKDFVNSNTIELNQVIKKNKLDKLVKSNENK